MNLDRERPDLEGAVKALLSRGDLGAAVTLVVQELGRGVRADLRRMLRGEDDLEDAFSEWSQRVLRGLPGFEFRCSLRTWCTRLAVNVALNFREDAWHRRVRRFVTGEASALAQSSRTSSDRRRRGQLRQLKEELDRDERRLFFLRVEEELSWNEIAEILTSAGDPVDAGAAQKRYERMKNKLGRLARRRRLLD